MGVFYITQPIGQYMLKEGTEEYHIYYDIYNDDEFEDYYFIQKYKSVTSKDFMEDVYKYFLELFEDKVVQHGTDERYSEDGYEKYIWIHLNKTSAEKDLKDIRGALEEQYLSKWRFQRIPTLLTIIKNQLNRREVLAYAVSDFQRRCGVVETQSILHILFNDIMNIV